MNNNISDQRQYLFDYTISNPPYQNTRNSAIFNYFNIILLIILKLLT